MKKVIERLSYLLNEVPMRVNQYSDREMSERKPNKWSKKEILGHLCDSASNNHHRFVKVQFEEQPFKVVGYKQNQWVSVQDYQSMSTEAVLELWVCLNKHLLWVLKKLPEEKYGHLCDIGTEKPVELSWLAQDYLDHMEHHLHQIFE